MDLPASFTAREQENHGKTDFSTGIAWMVTGKNEDFHGNDFGGNGKSRFLRELFGWDNGNDSFTGTGINPN